MRARDRLLQCRVFGHAWEEVSVGAVVDNWVSPPGYKEIIALRCMRCKTARLDSWNRWGVLGGRRYIYEDAYKELNEDLRESSAADDSSWHTAKKRYIEARRKERAEEREAARTEGVG